MKKLEQFIEWYFKTQASRACFRHREALTVELTNAFWDIIDNNAKSEKFAYSCVNKFFELKRRID